MTSRGSCSRCDCGWCVWTRRGVVLWRVVVSTGVLAVLLDHLLP